MKPNFEYKILRCGSLASLEAETEALLNDGWQKMSPTNWDTHSKCYLSEMIKVIERREDTKEYSGEEFVKRYNNLSQRLRDFLEINNIQLGVRNGLLFSCFDGEEVEGINPLEVLNHLKNAQHVPLDLKDDEILLELEGLI